MNTFDPTHFTVRDNTPRRFAPWLATCYALLVTASLHAAEPLSENFSNPPREFSATHFLRWTNGLVTEEGLAAEVAAFDEMNLRGFDVDDIQESHTPYERGPVRPMSGIWDQHTVETARLSHQRGLELGVFICPGFATSGGPWITPDTAMRFVAITATRVVGGESCGALPSFDGARDGHYRDIAVLAFPYPAEKRLSAVQGARFTTKDGKEGEFRAGQEFSVPQVKRGEKSEAWIAVSAPEPFTARTLELLGPGENVLAVDASDDAVQWREVAFYSDLGTGKSSLVPDPLRISLPEITAKHFRVRFVSASRGFRGFDLLDAPTLADYGGKSMALHRYEFLPQTLGEAAARWVVSPESVLNLTSKLQPHGKLDWQAPEGGDWLVLRMGSVVTSNGNHPAVEGRGMESDKFSAEATKLQFDSWIGRLANACQEAGVKPFPILHIDSYEAGSQNWTPLMFEEFKTRRGYDPVPWMPTFAGVIVGSPDLSDRFLRDYRRTASDLAIENYWGKLRELAHARGMKVKAQIYGNVWGEVWDSLQAAGKVDEVQLEFWGSDRPPQSEGYRQGARVTGIGEAAHVYGLPTVSAEAWTMGMDYALSPRDYKRHSDLMFARGVNELSPHGTAHQPWPKVRPGMVAQVYGPGFHHTQSWWGLSRSWWDYLTRCQYLIRQGQRVADVLYLYGEGAPLRLNTRHPQMPPGVTMDACTREIVLDRLSVDPKTGDLVLPQGQRYRLLLLPPDNTMTPELARKLDELVTAGAHVAGIQPIAAQGNAPNAKVADAEVRRIAEKLWSGEDRRILPAWDHSAIQAGWAKGEIKSHNAAYLPVAGLEAALAAAGIQPEVGGTAGEHDVAFIHRRTSEADLYFLSNQTGGAIDRPLIFRQTGRQPELWNPLDGTRHVARYETTTDGRISVPIHLPERGSIFVVFPQEATTTAAPPTLSGDLIPLTNPWTVTFEQNLGAPESVTLEKLASLHEHPDPGVKYFSGIATYRQVFNLMESQISNLKSEILLDLGEVHDIARVSVNGQEAGTAWIAPYRVSIPAKLLRPGENQLTIEVANPWFNRLIGDEQLPEDVPFEEMRGGRMMTAVPEWVTAGRRSPNGRVLFSSFLPGSVKKDAALRPSGLLGPVTLQTISKTVSQKE